MKISKYIDKLKNWGMTDNCKRKAIVYFTRFMLFMVICTIISRGIYTWSMAKVTYDSAKSMNITKTIKAVGQIAKGREVAVNVLPGILVEQVFVQSGEEIKENEPLLQLDLADLKKQTEKKQIELDKLNLTIKDLKNNEQLAKINKDNKINRAKEDAQLADKKNNEQINTSRQALGEAKDALEILGSKEEYCNGVQNGDSEINQAVLVVNQLENELASLKEQLSGDSSTDISSLELQISQKEKALSDAKVALENLKTAITSNAAEEWEQKKSNLEEIISQKQEKYEDAVNAREADVLQANRNIEDAEVSEHADSTLDKTQMDKTLLEEEVKEFQELLANNGLISSDKEGLITKITVTLGDYTPTNAAFLIADKEAELIFTAEVTKTQQKMLVVGDSVRIDFDAVNQVNENLIINSIENDPENPSQYMVGISVPPKGVAIGMSGTMIVEKQSERYQTCVPLETLHSDGIRNYILVITSKATILGEEFYAKRKDVNILDKNDMYAAIDAGIISDEEKVIVDSTKNIYDGEAVRLNEQ